MPLACTALGDVDKLCSQYTQEYQWERFLSTIATEVFNAEYNVFSQLTFLSKASHTDDIFLIINKNDVQQTAELFNKQFPKITFTTAYKTDLGLSFQDVRIL